MRVCVVPRYKYEAWGEGIYYFNNNNLHMFIDHGVDFFVVSNIGDVDYALSTCDGLYIPGGADINPKYYGEVVNGAEESFGVIDELDYACIEAFSGAGKPILGICRGFQVLNVYFGGSLYQDIADHRNVWHDVELYDGFVRDIYGTDKINVLSYHHQAIKGLAPGFNICAKSLDGYVEAISRDNIYGVQWHPEEYDGHNFIGFFVEELKSGSK